MSRLANPRLMAIVLGVLVLAVLLRILLTPSTPSNGEGGTGGSGQGQQGANLQAIAATRMAGAELLVVPPARAHDRVGLAALLRAGTAERQPNTTQQQIDRARLALARGAYGEAIDVLERLPGSGRAQELLAQARALRRQSAEGLMRDGSQLEQNGSLATAYRRYMAARAVDPAIRDIDEAIARVEGKMKTAGTDAYMRARQYDALGRTAEAIPLYEKAVELLPAGDPNRSTARTRLAELRDGGAR